VHITDAHLPNRLYYPNAGFETDSTAVEDFRAVMEDINLIHPEFVLFTGDLVNEGELESFANQYWYGWTQKLLSEFDIPVYVTSGNHDIGGWNQTPPPAGSARRNWWKYFGWNWLDSEDPNCYIILRIIISPTETQFLSGWKAMITMIIGV
jgi:3',5'-cyclic AMP phosphodiesterase CpdA